MRTKLAIIIAVVAIVVVAMPADGYGQNKCPGPSKVTRWSYNHTTFTTDTTWSEPWIEYPYTMRRLEATSSMRGGCLELAFELRRYNARGEFVTDHRLVYYRQCP